VENVMGYVARKLGASKIYLLDCRPALTEDAVTALIFGGEFVSFGTDFAAKQIAFPGPVICRDDGPLAISSAHSFIAFERNRHLSTS
jgi:hypothetical protein